MSGVTELHSSSRQWRSLTQKGKINYSSVCEERLSINLEKYCRVMCDIIAICDITTDNLK